jgi:hypothetical protein
MFVTLITDNITVGTRTYAAGSVVEVDKAVRKALVERGHAKDHEGPAFEPGATAEPATAKRSANVETAARR